MFGMQRIHIPTLATTLVILAVAFVVYHFVFARKGA
jgi:hypothetical protein